MNKAQYFKKNKPEKAVPVISTRQCETVTLVEINEYLYDNLTLSIIATFILATIIFFQLSKQIGANALNIWYSSVIAVLVARVGLLIWFRKTKNQTKLQNHHFNFFIILSSLFAGLWGILGSFLMPDNIFYQTFIIIFVSGILAGSTISLGARYLASMLYIYISVIPMIIWVTIQVVNGNEMYRGILIAMTLFLLYFSITAKKNSNLIISNINLKNTNIDLLQHLSKYLNQIELFSQMGESLEKCRSEEAIGKICRKYLPMIFPEFSGGIFLLSAGKTHLKSLEIWGGFSPKHQNLNFPKDECVASRNKTLYISHHREHCMHSPEPSPFYVCTPLQTRFEFYGILHLKLRKDSAFVKKEFLSSQKALFTRIANDIAFSLSTIHYLQLLQDEATKDQLTGLFNRRYLDSYFEIEFARLQRKSSTLSIIMIDIDFFKNFNDQYGHETGDEVLEKLGMFLKESVRGSDFACRYGGEEFILILPDASLEIATRRAQEIREGVTRITIIKDGKPIPVITVSLGVAVYPAHGDTKESLIEAADKALYRAKDAGRDKVCIANE